ncbi:ABC transporter ATP-binding protein [Nocardioides alcanivorans]|uniref:ABC transporter ATP-binding protein n=1 Tax=Nocardioides alcanivorans TaxID=2897352 RepID=UPI001F169D45|nr:ABC transporter ATP-binding protein [Nocardioides alcanivorans]
MTMLEITDLTVRYADTPAVEHVSLEVTRGEVLAVLGPSGCGKSTLLRAVAGLEPSASGAIRAEGKDLSRVPTHKRGFALMFQDGQLFNQQTVAGNIGYPLRIRRRPRPEVKARVAELLALIGLEALADRRPDELSGGERQRVALARALAVRPRLLLLDEPLSALDAALRDRLAGDLRRILTAEGTTALLVTHDHEEAFAVADRMALMRAGRVVQSGAPADVWAAPVDAEAAIFLGYDRVLEGAAAGALLREAGLPDAHAVALRRSALEVHPGGALVGTVLAFRSAPELLRLTVDVPGIGVLSAVARSAQEWGEVGSAVSLRVVGDRLAVLGGS